MAGNLSSAFQDALANFIVRGVAYTRPPALYVGLLTDPSTEVTGTNYLRQVIPEAGMAPAAGGLCTSTVDITFPTAGSTWGVITHFAVYDGPGGATPGAMLYLAAVAGTPLTINTGDTFRFNAGGLSVGFD